MIPISILFFLLIIILILIICSIIVSSVQVREISGGRGYLKKNKYFGGDNDNLFTEIMGYLKLKYNNPSITKIKPSQIRTIINNAYKTKYGIKDIFDKEVGRNITLFQYYLSLTKNQKADDIYLTKQNIDSIQHAINNIIDNKYVEDENIVENHAKARIAAMNDIDQLLKSNNSSPNKLIYDNSSIDSDDSDDSDDSSVDRFNHSQQFNGPRVVSPVVLPSSKNSSIDSNSSRNLFSPVNLEGTVSPSNLSYTNVFSAVEAPRDENSSLSSTDSIKSNIYKIVNPIAVYPDNTTRSQPPSRSPSPMPRSKPPSRHQSLSPISRLQTPLPLSPSQYQSLSPPQSPSRSLSPLLSDPERSSSPSQSQFLQNSRSNQRHNPPLRGRSQNDSSFDEELNMAEINAKNTESALGDIKNNLYSKMNQDQKNQEELYTFIDNIRHTEYQ
jgi:hypothetical protein